MTKNIYQTDHTQTPLLFELITDYRNDEAIEHLEQHPEEVKLKGWMDYTPLHKAAESGNLEMAQYLIDQGAEVNARRSGIYPTPLCWAKTAEVANLLIDSGATLEGQELLMATSWKRPEVIEVLLKRGAKIDDWEPQFLKCQSVEALGIYLKYGADLSWTNEHNCSILHEAAWLNNIEVFEYAFKNGAKWSKDLNNRTPYAMALQGKRQAILQHLRQNYPELTSHQITKVALNDLSKFEQTRFLKEHPVKDNEFFVLTVEGKLIRYHIDADLFRAQKAISIDLATIRNFTFSPQHELIIPTADFSLLRINAESLELIESISIDMARLDQITYLPKRNVYFASDGWESYWFSSDFHLLNQQQLIDGLFYPIIHQDESFMATYSYDQEVYHSLCKIEATYELKVIKTFFNDYRDCSSGFAFGNNGKQFAVSYPKYLESCELIENEVKQLWATPISSIPSKDDLNDLCYVNDEQLLLAKGKTLVSYDAKSGKVLHHLKLELRSEIRGLQLNRAKDLIMVSTIHEVVPVAVNALSSGKTDSDLKKKSWFGKLWN